MIAPTTTNHFCQNEKFTMAMLLRKFTLA